MRTTSTAAAVGLVTVLAFTPGLASPASAEVPTCDGKAATLVVQPTTGWPKPWVVGTSGDDVIVGTDDPDRIDGGAGNDTICSLGSFDHVVGGTGDDRLFGGLDEYYPDDDYWGDVIEPGPGDDHVDLGFQGGWKDIDFVDSVYADQVSYAHAAGPVAVDLATLTATGEGTDTIAATPAGKFTGIIGSAHDDVLTGGPAEDQIHGGGGDDVVDGGPGDDIVGGGDGADVLAGDDGEDYLTSSGDAAGTTLDGGPGDDSFATSQQTRARGGGGDDAFELGIGRGTKVDSSRVVNGGNGRDRIQLTSYVGGRVRYDIGIHVPKRRITVGGGLFAKMTGAEEFIVEGNDGKGLVAFRGGARPELFRLRWVMKAAVRASGGGGNDVLIGNYQDDVLDGGPGRDRLDGSRGRDRCVQGERLRSCERR